MGYKKLGMPLSFADLAVKKTMEHNRNLKMMKRIDEVVNWRNIEALLMEYYEVGKSKEGADAYSPLLLSKCMLLQKWFHIPQDPELENRINNCISFKKFLGLPLDKASPDYSTFSRFRSSLAKDAMAELNSEVLREFAKRGLSINEGVAVDGRLVKSVSLRMSNEDLRKGKEKRESAEGQLDRNGKPVKFCKDLESDWTVKNDEPHYGLKEHVSVDVEDGFVLGMTITPACEHDSKYLPYLALASCYTDEPIKKIYADKGYFGQPNRSFLNLNDIEDGIMRKDTTTAKLTEFEIQMNKQISKNRYIVEKYFNLSHLHDKAYRAKFTERVKNLWDSMCRQMAFNMFRGSKLVTC